MGIKLYTSSFLFSLSLIFSANSLATTPITYGSDLTGWINTLGESHDYTFQGTAGDRIFIRVRGTSNGVDGCIELFDPSGASIAADCDDGGYVTIDGYELTSTGTYTIHAKDHDDNDTGFYGLSLQIVNNPAFTTSIDCQIDMVGELTHQAEIDAFSYNANAGDVLIIRMRGEAGNIESRIRLYNPSGNILAEGTSTSGTTRINTFNIPTDGIYTILAYDGNGNDIGNYGFSFQVVKPTACAESIECGSFSANINSIAEMHAYAFDANAGDLIHINMRGGNGVEAELELYNEAGLEIANDNPNGGTARIENFSIPTTGTYFVMARDKKGNDIGDYGFSYHNMNNLNCASELDCNANLTASIDGLAEADYYYFQATAGERIMLQMRATSSSLEGELSLYNSAGTLIAEDSPGGTLCEVIDIAIPADGTYFVKVNDKHGNDTGDYGLSFQKLDLACANEFICADGAVTGNFNSLAAMDAYYFSGTAGDLIKIKMVEMGTELEPLIYVYDPNHDRIIDETASHDINIDNFELTQTGTYIAIAMDRNGNDLGAYTLNIECAIEAEDITPPVIAGCEDAAFSCNEVNGGTGSGDMIEEWLNTVTATDDSGSVTMSNDFAPITFSCNGGNVVTQLVTFTAIDDNNNISTCQSTITISDDLAPDFDNQPSNISDITSGDNLPEQETLTATDACGDATVVKSIDPYEINNCGDYEVIYRWTATDGCGNSNEVTRSFNVYFNTDDLSNSCPEDLTVTLGEEGFVQLDAASLWGFDNDCNFDFFSFDDLYFTCDDEGANEISFSIMSNNQVLTVCNFNITIDASNCASSTPPDYCESYGSANGNKWIQSFTMGTYINWSGSDNGYGDYTSEVIDMAYPSAVTIELDPYKNTPKHRWAIWIDFNQDGDFSDDEKVYSAYGKNTLYGTIEIPETVNPGTTRMRVSMKTGWEPDPCSTFSAGEVEDYTINLIGGSSFGGLNPNPTPQNNNQVQQSQPSIETYPNPAKDYIMVDMSTFDNQVGVIQIHNSFGQQIWTSGTQQLSNTAYQIDISSLKLPAGIYRVSVIYGKRSVSNTIYVNNE